LTVLSKKGVCGLVAIIVGGVLILASEGLHSVLLMLMVAYSVASLVVWFWVVPTAKQASPGKYAWTDLLRDVAIALCISAAIYGGWLALVLWAAASG